MPSNWPYSILIVGIAHIYEFSMVLGFQTKFETSFFRDNEASIIFTGYILHAPPSQSSSSPPSIFSEAPSRVLW